MTHLRWTVVIGVMVLIVALGSAHVTDVRACQRNQLLRRAQNGQAVRVQKIASAVLRQAKLVSDPRMGILFLERARLDRQIARLEHVEPITCGGIYP